MHYIFVLRYYRATLWLLPTGNKVLFPILYMLPHVTLDTQNIPKGQQKFMLLYHPLTTSNLTFQVSHINLRVQSSIT